MVVAQHHGGAFDQDLAVLDLHLAVFDHAAHVLPGGGVCLAGGGDARGALGHTVALQEGQTHFGVGLCQLRGEIGPAAEDDPQILPEYRKARKAQRQQRVFLLLRHDAAVDGLRDQRHEQELGGLEELDVLHKAHGGVVDAERGPVAQGEQQVTGEAVGVVDGQDGEQHVVLAALIVTAGGVVDEVCVGEHNALAFARGAGGIEDTGAALRIQVRKLRRRLLVEQVLQGAAVLPRGKADKGSDLRAGFSQRRDHRLKSSVVEEHGHVRPVQVVRDLLGAELWVDGDGHIAADDRAEQAGDAGDARRSEQARVDRRLPLTAQEGAHLPAVLQHLAEALFRDVFARLFPQPDLLRPLPGGKHQQVLHGMKLCAFHRLSPACSGYRP